MFNDPFSVLRAIISLYPLHSEEILALTPPLPDDLVSIGACHYQHTLASLPVLILMTFLILHLISLAHTSGPEQKLKIDFYYTLPNNNRLVPQNSCFLNNCFSLLYYLLVLSSSLPVVV